jgi:predicted TIM-barrel fold metal-dependent hydrolase
MTLLYSMIYSGVLERHPRLTLLLAEVGTGWLPFLFREIDDRISPTAELFVGKWKLPMKPSEYLARNVRATPLDGGNDRPPPRILEELPDEMIVFSSDFPHSRVTDPAAHYAQALKEVSPERRARFGGSIADVYRRMGDPLSDAAARAAALDLASLSYRADSARNRLHPGTRRATWTASD